MEGQFDVPPQSTIKENLRENFDFCYPLPMVGGVFQPSK
jgi:hypothetical protein